MVNVDTWLPVGSVVHIEGNDGLTAVTGYMQQDADKGRLWDYVGVPYPLGWSGPGRDIMFDRESIDAVYFIGLQDTDSTRMIDMLLATEPAYYAAKREVCEELGLPTGDVDARLAAIDARSAALDAHAAALDGSHEG